MNDESVRVRHNEIKRRKHMRTRGRVYRKRSGELPLGKDVEDVADIDVRDTNESGLERSIFFGGGGGGSSRRQRIRYVLVGICIYRRRKRFVLLIYHRLK